MSLYDTVVVVFEAIILKEMAGWRKTGLIASLICNKRCDSVDQLYRSFAVLLGRWEKQGNAELT
jgi:hypothetical protein